MFADLGRNHPKGSFNWLCLVEWLSSSAGRSTSRHCLGLEVVVRLSRDVPMSTSPTSLYASPKFGLNLGAVTSAPHIHWGEMASMKKKPWVVVYFLTKLVDEASLVALSRMIWIDQQFSRLQNFDWSTWTVQAPFESAIHELLLRRRSWWIALSCLWCPFWTNLLEMEIPKVWRNILSTPERYGSGDRSFASWPTQIVSVSKSHVVDRWNAVLCLQKSLCSRPDRCHCHRFCRRLGLLFILVHYRRLDLTPVDYCPQFSPAQAPCSWTFTSTKKLVDHTFLSVVNTLTIFTGNGGALSVGIYSVDPRKVWKWRSKFGKWTDTNCVGLQVIRCRSMKLSALLAKITL